MKTLILSFLTLTIFNPTEVKIPIPARSAEISLKEYKHAVNILENVNNKSYTNYATFLQAALSYDALKQSETQILDLIDQAYCEDAEATCRLLLHMEAARWISFENIAREEIDAQANRCYCQ